MTELQREFRQQLEGAPQSEWLTSEDNSMTGHEQSRMSARALTGRRPT